MKTVLIGIDPGTKTGVAVWSPKGRFLEITTTTIDKAMQIVEHYAKQDKVFVRFEDARLRKWFGGNSYAKRQGAGSVKRDCSIWEGFLKRLNVEFEAVAPKDCITKMKADYFKAITGYCGRTSEHARDAAILVYMRHGIIELYARETKKTTKQ
ncbi:MAG: hypothetical protein WC446_05825 [Candidatus Paceibacterota bacterium]|jgi:hypothetical protein